MAEKLLLFLGDKVCRAALWRHGMLLGEQEFNNDDEGRRVFATYAKKSSKAVGAIIADLVEEDYRQESVPHLIGRDKRLFLAKKLDQFFHHTPFRSALVQSRADRKKDNVLFSGLTAPDRIAPWVELLGNNDIPLCGVYSVAMLSGWLVEKTPFSHLLLLSFEKHGGLRQTFFLNNRLRFSRLTPLGITDDLVETVLTETARFYKYLHTLNLLPDAEPLTTGVLCNRIEREKLAKRIIDSPAVRHVYFDLDEVAKRIGFKGEMKNSDSAPLFFHMLGARHLPNQYGNSLHLHEYRLWQWRRLAGAMSLLTLLAGGIWGGLGFAEGVAVDRRAQALGKQSSLIDDQYQRIVQTFPVAPAKAEGMKAAVSISRKLAAVSPDPAGFLSKVSAALAGYPSIKINHLSWQPSENPDAVKTDAGPADASAIEGRMLDDARFRQVLLVGGEIEPFSGNFRSAIEMVNGFSRDLARQGASVSVEKLPLDLNPNSSFSGSVRPADAARAEFLLKLVFKEGA